MTLVTKESIIDNFAKVSESPIHGLGLFAKEPIKVGTHLGQYEGENVTPSTAHKFQYVLWDKDETGHLTGIEGSTKWAYANSSKNTQFDPNVKIDPYTKEFCAIKDIEEGEEMLYDYQII